MVVWAELQFHAWVIASHKRLNQNAGTQIALKKLGQAIDGDLTVPHALGLYALNRQERVGRIVG